MHLFLPTERPRSPDSRASRGRPAAPCPTSKPVDRPRRSDGGHVTFPFPFPVHPTGPGRNTRRAVAVLLAAAVLASGCGGRQAGEASDATERGVPEAVESGLDQAGEPVRGGSLAYGLEAGAAGGWCLPDAQLAISGIMVARAVYDTLTVPNDDGDYVPWLAERVEPNEGYDEWTITLRPGVTFHDGSTLDSLV